jgi:hypothetical protein
VAVRARPGLAGGVVAARRGGVERLRDGVGVQPLQPVARKRDGAMRWPPTPASLSAEPMKGITRWE